MLNSPAPDPMPLIGPQYGIAPAADTVGEPTPYEVSGMPPEPLYEQMTDSPGDGYVWVDGYWHWNGDEWVWVAGRWEREQDGYAYVEPYYGYSDGGYYYTPGYWRSQRNVPAGWSVTGTRGNGRPPVLQPPVGWHPTPIASRPGPVGSWPRPGGNGGGGGTYLPPTQYPNRPLPNRPGPSPGYPSETTTSLYPTGPEHAPPASGRAPEPEPGLPTRTPPAEYPTGSQRSGVIVTEHPVYNPPSPPASYPTGPNHAPPPSPGGGTTIIYREPTPAPTSYQPTRQAPSAPSAPPSHSSGGGGSRPSATHRR
jgi:hypothetical protein